MKLILFAAVAVCVAGQQTMPPESHAMMVALRHVFHRLDSNNDGELTLNEQLAYFDKIDTNNDAKLSAEEFEASRRNFGDSKPQMPAGYDKATFLFYDTMAGTQPADGFLTRNDMSFFFGFIDLNGNGVVTLREFDTASIQIGKTILQMLDSTAATPVGK